MAKPLASGKQSVDLAAGGVRVSKIRREPPPVVKRLSLEDRDDRDRRMAIVGVVLFALALVVILIGLGNFAGWSPSQYTVRVEVQ